MSMLKILTEIDKATQAVDKISTMFDPKPAPSKKPLTAEEREKGLQPLFRDIYPDL